jgi:hypothetical protein
MKRLSDGATEVRLSLSDTRYVRALFICSFFLNIIRLLDEAAASDQLARELLSKASDIVSGLESNFIVPGLFYIVYSSSRRSCCKRRDTAR